MTRLTPEQVKEELSRAYVHAVAARCGFAVAGWSQDHWGIDVTIGAAGPLGGGTLASPKLDLQLKCTSREGRPGDVHLGVQIPRPQYDRLRARKSVPQLLVLLELPDDEAQWIQHSADALIIRRCAYWVKMTGMPPAEGESRVVHLPRAQVFSPEQLRSLMEKLSREEEI